MFLALEVPNIAENYIKSNCAPLCKDDASFKICLTTYSCENIISFLTQRCLTNMSYKYKIVLYADRAKRKFFSTRTSVTTT